MTKVSLPLSEVATVIRGVSFDKGEAHAAAQDGYLPILRAGNIETELILDQDLVWVPEARVAADQRMRPGDIAICMSSGSQAVVGKTAPLLHKWNGSVGAFCALVRPQEARVLPAYLSYFLKSEVFRAWTRQSTGANIKNIRKSELEAFRVPTPSLDEQRRIVDLLSRAEGIVRLRREAQKKAQAIIPALFLDMFGDPSTNPKGLPMRPVRDFVARFEGGKNLQAASDGSTAFRILKVSAITSGQYVESESKPTPERYEPPRNHLVRVGDMLFSRANTQQLVGATAVVEATDGFSLLPDKLWRFVWAEEVDQRYMHALFQSKHVRTELGKLSSGTSASMRNISQEKLYGLQVPVATLPEQKAFGRHAEAMRSILRQQTEALQVAEVTFNALLARTFRNPDDSCSSVQIEYLEAAS